MITFKELEVGDCEFLNEVRNECAEEFLHDSSVYSVEETITWYKNLTIPYYIVYNDFDRIGYFRLSNYSEKNSSILIGMDIHKKFRGNGYAYNAYIKFIPYITKKYNLNKVSLEVLATNAGAYALYKKLGFVEEGIKRQEILKNNKYVDSIIMSLLKEEVENSTIYCI